jgi:hypothetical protein
MDWKMRTHTVSERVAALLLGSLLVSCGVTRGLAPTSTEELSHLVLFIQEQPDGTVTHSWKRVEELDLGPLAWDDSAHRARHGLEPRL